MRLLWLAMPVWAATTPSLPVIFEPTAAPQVFLAQAHGERVRIEATRLVFLSSGAELRFPQARPTARVAGEGRLPGTSNYFLGHTQRTGVPHFARVRIAQLYEGVDLVLYNAFDARGRSHLEYDFELSPRADAAQIRLDVRQATASVDEAGHLTLATRAGRFTQRAPVVYARMGAGRTPVEARYAVEGGRIRFVLGSRPAGAPLVIDPVLDFATYLGGAGLDAARSVKVDAQGAIYLAGEGRAANSTSQEAVVAKFLPATQTIAYYTFLGGDQDDVANALQVDAAGQAYVAGTTRSANFPTRNNPFAFGGAPFSDAFTAKVSADGRSLVYATFLGGSGPDEGLALALDGQGSAYVAGSTASRNFPVTNNAWQTTFRGGTLQQPFTAFLAKFSPTGERLVYSSLCGGSAQDAARAVAVDAQGQAWVAGTTTSSDFPMRNALLPVLPGAQAGFFVRFNADGSSLLSSSYFGGRSLTSIQTVALDGHGNVYLGGSTNSPDLATRNAFQSTYGGGESDGWVARLNSAGNEIAFCTLLGGSEADAVTDLAVDGGGLLTVVGQTASANFPTRNSLQPYAGRWDAFVTRFNAQANALLWSTFLGGADDDRALGVALEASGDAMVAGLTASRDWPVTRGAAQASYAGGAADMFLARVQGDQAGISVSGLLVSATSLNLTVAAGAAVPPPPVSISVTAAQTTPFTVEWSTTNGGSWLSAGPQRAETPASINVFVNPAGLAPELYTGQVRLVPLNGSAPTLLAVSFRVTAPGPGISQVLPSSVPVGAPDTEFTFTGSGFSNNSVVHLITGEQTPPIILTPTAVTASQLRVTVSRNYFFRDAVLRFRVAAAEAALSNLYAVAVGNVPPVLDPNGIVNSASFRGGAVAPGELLLLSGVALGPATPARMDASDSNTAPTRLAGVRVLFDGTPAPLLLVSERQIAVAVPFAAAARPGTQVVVETAFGRSAPVALPVAVADPGIYTVEGLGTGLAAATNENGSANSTANRAARGSVIVLYATGLGLLNPPAADGRIATAPLGRVVLPVTVTIDGEPAEVLYAGEAPGQLSAIVQINVRIPRAVRPNGQAPIVVRAGDALSQPGVTVAVE